MKQGTRKRKKKKKAKKKKRRRENTGPGTVEEMGERVRECER